MRAASLTSIVLAVTCATACSTKHEPNARARPRAQALLTGAIPEHMRNCPSAVEGATTTAALTPDGVELTITAKDPDARREIAARAALHGQMLDPVWLVSPHSRAHGGPGSIGRCPIIHANTLVTYEPTSEGVLVHVISRTKGDVGRLQRATQARIRGMTLPSS